MINLIPTEAKKYVRMEYWTRVISVWLFLVTSAALIIIALLIPSLVLVNAQLQVFENGAGSVDAQNDKYDILKSEITGANNTAQQLLSTKNQRTFHTVISRIENATNKTVRIKSITASRNQDEAIETLQVVGVADSRQALVDFRDTLEAVEMFDAVELPLSNLAKDADVPFNLSIQLTPAEQ